MRTNKVFAVLCSTLFAGSLAFVPAVASQASAAPKPAQAAAVHPSLITPYRDGFRQGFRNGYADAKDSCDRSFALQTPRSQQLDSRWAQGYADGYDEGYSRSFAQFC